MPPEGTVKWKARAVEHRRAAGYPLELDQPPRLPHRSRHAGPWQTGPVPTGAQRTLDRFLRDAAACAGNRHAGNADRKQARPTNIRDEFRADDLRVLQPGSASTIGVNPWGGQYRANKWIRLLGLLGGRARWPKEASTLRTVR